MASFTPKYKLEKPAPEDFYDITVFNANMDKVEEALGKKPDKTELPAEVKKAVQDGTLTAADLGAVSAADKGKPNGVAGLGSDGKVPQAQLPEMDYAPASHATNKNNPHGVTAAQVGAIPTSQKGAKNGVASLDANGKVSEGQLPPMDYAPVYTYGTEDLTAGTSPLETGKLYFVYE